VAYITFNESWTDCDWNGGYTLNWPDDPNGYVDVPLIPYMEALRQATVQRCDALVANGRTLSGQAAAGHAWLAGMDWGIPGTKSNVLPTYIDKVIDDEFIAGHWTQGFLDHVNAPGGVGSWDHSSGNPATWTEANMLAHIGTPVRIVGPTSGRHPYPESAWVHQVKLILENCKWSRRDLLKNTGGGGDSWPEEEYVYNPDGTIAYIEPGREQAAYPFCWLTYKGAYTYFQNDNYPAPNTWVEALTQAALAGRHTNSLMYDEQFHAANAGRLTARNQGTWLGGHGQHIIRQSNMRLVNTNPQPLACQCDWYIDSESPEGMGFSLVKSYSIFAPMGVWDFEGYNLYRSDTMTPGQVITSDWLLPEPRVYPPDPYPYAIGLGYTFPGPLSETGANVGCAILNAFAAQNHAVPGGFTVQ